MGQRTFGQQTKPAEEENKNEVTNQNETKTSTSIDSLPPPPVSLEQAKQATTQTPTTPNPTSSPTRPGFLGSRPVSGAFRFGSNQYNSLNKSATGTINTNETQNNARSQTIISRSPGAGEGETTRPSVFSQPAGPKFGSPSPTLSQSAGGSTASQVNQTPQKSTNQFAGQPMMRRSFFGKRPPPPGK